MTIPAEQIIFHSILGETLQTVLPCVACKEAQPNQIAHYSGCLLLPRLHKGNITRAIRRFPQFPFSIDLWMAVSHLIEEHNHRTSH